MVYAGELRTQLAVILAGRDPLRLDLLLGREKGVPSGDIQGGFRFSFFFRVPGLEPPPSVLLDGLTSDYTV